MDYSVVVPVYNRAGSLRRAIESAQRQSVPPKEIILVDDYSRDNSWALMQQLATEDARIRIARLAQNSGAPTARNHGAAMATAQFLAFLDSDDSWMPQKSQHQLSLLHANPSAPAAFCHVEIRVGEEAATIMQVPPVLSYTALQADNYLGGCSNVMVRRAAFEQVGGFLPDMPSCQDWELWLRLARIADLVAVQEPLVAYYVDAGNQISRNRARVEEGHRRLFTILRDNAGTDADRRRVDSLYALKLAEVYSKLFADHRAAIGKLAEGVGRYPSLRHQAAAAKTGLKIAKRAVTKAGAR